MDKNISAKQSLSAIRLHLCRYFDHTAFIFCQVVEEIVVQGFGDALQIIYPHNAAFEYVVTDWAVNVDFFGEPSDF